MPGLDYRAGVPVYGANTRALIDLYGARFYNGSPGRELVCCPDCGLDADAMFGDHGGCCRPTTTGPGRAAAEPMEVGPHGG